MLKHDSVSQNVSSRAFVVLYQIAYPVLDCQFIFIVNCVVTFGKLCRRCIAVYWHVVLKDMQREVGDANA